MIGTNNRLQNPRKKRPFVTKSAYLYTLACIKLSEIRKVYNDYNAASAWPKEIIVLQGGGGHGMQVYSELDRYQGEGFLFCKFRKEVSV